MQLIRPRVCHPSLFLLVAFVAALALQLHSPRVAQGETRGATSSLDSLWLDIGLGPPLVEWYEEVARPDDIARANSIEQIDLLDGISTGRKLVVFKSVAAAEEALPDLAGRIDIVGYNLEHGPANPPDEQADPVGSIRRMRALADRYGLQVAVGPDHDFAVSHGAAMAPYADIVVLQIQRAQTEPGVVKEFVLPLAEQIRRANPDAELSVQVRTEGDVHAITELLSELEPELAGVSILTSPETVDTAVDLVSAIRPSQPIPELRREQQSPAPSTRQPAGANDSDAAETTSRFRAGFLAGSVAALFGVGFVLFGIAAVLLAVTAAVFLLWALVREGNRNDGA